jgi:hypothetical protein
MPRHRIERLQANNCAKTAPQVMQMLKQNKKSHTRVWQRSSIEF